MKSKWFWWGFVLVWCGTIFSFSQSSLFTGANTAKVIRHIVQYFGLEGTNDHSDSVFSFNFIIRKFAHLSAFGFLAFLVWKAMFPNKFSYIGAWCFTVLYAASDEWHQSFRPGRTALFSDVLIDAAGAFMVLLFVRFYLRRKRY
ncbi:MAG: VanZ family protein [Bacillales bacterium]|nr:VanZ family protein [Bacillales bacterium]